MIHFFIGTKAQLIKTAPVIIETERLGIPFRYIDTGQHAEFTSELRRELNLPKPNFELRDKKNDVATYWTAINWLSKLMERWAFSPKWIRENVFGGDNKGICVVHGDTMSTYLGMMYARRIGLRIAHLEAGLRSFKIFDPFPEELIRIRCMKRASLLYAPDRVSINNLRKMKVNGQIIDTRGNTVIDTLKIATSRDGEHQENQNYILATFHRLETLRSKKRVKILVDTLNLAAQTAPVKFVMHKPTKKALEKFDLLKDLDPKVQQLPMQNYFEFVRLIRGAKCIFADGGSIQEECAILGVPLLILRKCSERHDGLDYNARIAEFDLDICRDFLERSEAFRQKPSFGSTSPSALVADSLACNL